MIRGARGVFVVLLLVAIMLADESAGAHSGPPFPILSNHAAGAYQISVWTDPDATDDGAPGGQFWITVRATSGAAVPPDTRVRIAIAPTDRRGATIESSAEPTPADAGQRFAALLMDHEGPFSVRVTVDGPLGRAGVDASVDATYDLRPAPIMLIVYAIPFALVGLLWIKLLLKRRSPAARGES